jgi:putative aminopeptidase FrvX
MKDLELDTGEIVRTQRELSELIGCPGHEEEVAEYVLARIRPLAESARRDRLGNVTAVLPASAPEAGPASGRERILLDAHMDEVGFMVSHIEENGCLRIDSLGGVDKRVLPGTLLQFKSDEGERIIAVTGFIPPHATRPEERDKVADITEMFADPGLRSCEQVEAAGLHIGSVGTFHTAFISREDGVLIGKAFDDRSGCNVLIQTLTALSVRRRPHTLLFNFAVQEEVGQAGALVAGRALEPTLALAVENTLALDIPDVPARKVVTRLGGGPALTAADRSLIAPRRVLDRLRAAAEAAGVGWQYKKPVYGGSDAGKIFTTGAGVPTGVVSVPCRYIHGPAGLLRTEDLLATIRLTAAFCLLE